MKKSLGSFWELWGQRQIEYWIKVQQIGIKGFTSEKYARESTRVDRIISFFAYWREGRWIRAYNKKKDWRRNNQILYNQQQKRFSYFNFISLQIENISKFYTQHSGIMKNIAPKQFKQVPHSNLFHPPSLHLPLGQLSQHINNKPILSHYSNYHTSTNGLVHQPHIQLSTLNRCINQRAASAESARSIFTGVFSPQQFTAISTKPCIFNSSSKQKIKFQKLPKKNPHKAISQQNLEQMEKVSPKPTTKNIYINRNNQKESLCVDGKQSVSSTINQTIKNQSDILWNKKKIEKSYKGGEIETVEEERILKMVEGIKQKIEDQSSIIQKLKKIILEQERKIELKQDQISTLRKSFDDQVLEKIRVKNRIEKIQKFLSEFLTVTLKKGEALQEGINSKIDQIKQYFLAFIALLKRSKQDSEKMEEIAKNLQALKNANQTFFSNFGRQTGFFSSQLLTLRTISQKIKKNSFAIRQFFSQSTNQMSETGKFCQVPSTIHFSNVSQDFQPIERHLLDQSSSYFFYPNQLQNLEKIKELYSKNGQPIHCYISKQNQLKYKQTNTYIFNMKGQIITLTDFQKKYYLQNGFIIVYKSIDI